MVLYVLPLEAGSPPGLWKRFLLIVTFRECDFAENEVRGSRSEG